MPRPDFRLQFPRRQARGFSLRGRPAGCSRSTVTAGSHLFLRRREKNTAQQDPKVNFAYDQAQLKFKLPRQLGRDQCPEDKAAGTVPSAATRHREEAAARPRGCFSGAQKLRGAHPARALPSRTLNFVRPPGKAGATCVPLAPARPARHPPPTRTASRAERRLGAHRSGERGSDARAASAS